MYFINTFFVYAFLGHFLETFFYPTGESGIFYGWWTPIYGIGSLFIIAIYLFLKKRFHWNTLIQFLFIFFIGAILLSLIEWIGGTLIEYIFNVSFWNYEKLQFSIGKYAALEMAFIWGCGSLILVFLAKPCFDYVIKKIPKWLTSIFIILFITDVLLTFLFKAK